jgi:hypothetical protein
MDDGHESVVRHLSFCVAQSAAAAAAAAERLKEIHDSGCCNV